MIIEEKYVNMVRNIMKTLHTTYVGEGAAAFISDIANIEEL